MNYIIKDLMISILPQRPVNLPGAWCDAGCTPCSDCSKCSTTTPGGMDRYNQVSNPAELSALKQQLREALAMVEAREKVVHEAMRPKTIHEIEILQAQLTNALENLRETARDLETKGRE